MNMSLTSLKSNLSSKETQKYTLERQNAGYQTIINEIRPIYQEMKRVKDELSEQKDMVSSFAGESYDLWKGKLFSDKYQTELEDGLVSSSYPELIREIDMNLDALNDKMTEYENKILQNQGLIGPLATGINILINAIQNYIY